MLSRSGRWFREISGLLMDVSIRNGQLARPAILLDFFQRQEKENEKTPASLR
jgi:hypothetical protein